MMCQYRERAGVPAWAARVGWRMRPDHLKSKPYRLKKRMDSIFKTVISGNNGHPSEDELLLYVDGELEAKATNHVRNHLEACWSCRVRTEKIEETISSFIDYRNQVLKPLVEQPPHGWRGFDGRLNRLANEVGRPSLFANVRGTLGRIKSSPAMRRLLNQRLEHLI